MSLSVYVCLLPNSTKTTGSFGLKFWGMIPMMVWLLTEFGQPYTEVSTSVYSHFSSVVGINTAPFKCKCVIVSSMYIYSMTYLITIGKFFLIILWWFLFFKHRAKKGFFAWNISVNETSGFATTHVVVSPLHM